MHIMIIGGAGMLGRKLADALVQIGHLDGQTIDHLTLADVIDPTPPLGFSGTIDMMAVDLSGDGVATKLVKSRPDVIFHLAAIVSSDAEANFEKGYRVNLDGTRALFEAIRLAGDDYCPRVVFSSSVAVFGAPFPQKIDDEFFLTPLSSYGTQKAICELLLADYSRHGHFDGIGIRLPTICIRPGKPNKAASSFFSSILREPLSGVEAVLPVPGTLRHWFASPRAAIGFLLHAAAIDLTKVGPRRNLSLPGISATIDEMIEALRRVAGDEAVNLIRHEPDEAIMKIVGGWAEDFDVSRAEGLGFEADASLDAIIQAYLEDDFHKG